MGLSGGSSPQKCLIAKICSKLFSVKQVLRDCFGTSTELFCEVVQECSGLIRLKALVSYF